MVRRDGGQEERMSLEVVLEPVQARRSWARGMGWGGMLGAGATMSLGAGQGAAKRGQVVGASLAQVFADKNI